MRVRARVHVIGMESPSTYSGAMVQVEPASYVVPVPGGGSVTKPGTSITVDAMTSWVHADRACELTELAISAAIDLRAMVLTRGDYSITIGRTECSAPTLTWPWRAYELLNWAASTDVLPYTVRLTDDGVRRIGEIVECALRSTATDLWAIADGMAAAERAAMGISAPERVLDLWTGLEALTPVPSSSSAIAEVSSWLDGVEASTPGFRRAVATLVASDLDDLLRARSRLAKLPGVRRTLASLVTGPCRTRQERLRVATACIYAIRNAFIHGSISGRTTRDVDAIRGAERVAWILLDARLSQLLCGAIPVAVSYRAAVAVTK